MEWNVILASASPRRRDLMQQIGVSFQVCQSNADEASDETDPELLVELLARRKAEEVANMAERGAYVIGADTIVECEGKIMGKPKDAEDAYQMLSKLQGNELRVFTGVSVFAKEKQTTEIVTFSEKTLVTLYPMTKEQIQEFVDSGEPLDKAGAYSVQGGAAIYTKKVEGDYYNIIGLPIARLYQELLKRGIDLKKKILVPNA